MVDVQTGNVYTRERDDEPVDAKCEQEAWCNGEFGGIKDCVCCHNGRTYCSSCRYTLDEDDCKNCADCGEFICSSCHTEGRRLKLNGNPYGHHRFGGYRDDDGNDDDDLFDYLCPKCCEADKVENEDESD